MVHIARLLTAAALVSVSVAAPMKARSNDNNNQQGGGNSYQQGSDSNGYQQGNDNSYQQGNNGYQQGDNSYQQGGNSYQQGSNSYQQGGYQQGDNSYQQGGYQQSDNSYQSSSSYNNNYQTTSSYDNNYSTSTMEQSSMTTSSESAYSTPSYGSGNQNWGSGYNDCVMQCAASYGMPSGMYSPPTETASESSMYGGQTGTNGVTHTIIVAPTQGVFRYMPFSTNASVGDTVEFYWANGEHTVTSGSSVEVCTKNDQGGFDSGKNKAGFQ
jgi:plastocyanin